MYDTYTPKQFKDSMINRCIIKKLQNINKYTFMNTLLYGSNGTGKYTLSKMFLNNIFDNSIYSLKNQEIICNTKSLDYYSSIYHYEVYISKKYKHLLLKELITKIAYSMNINTSSYNIVLIKNAHYFTKETILFIKQIIEKRGDVVKFILTCNSIDKLLYLKPFFMAVRIPKLGKNELYNYIKHIVLQENIHKQVKMNDTTINTIIEKSNHNIYKILYNLKLYIETSQYENLIFIDKIIEPLITLIKKKNTKYISEIRTLLYKYCAMNINKDIIIKTIYNNIITSVSDFNKKKQIIDLTATIDHKMNISYKEIIHLEYYIITLMTII
jgi:DNA polymerase III delta prime subunit